MSTSTSPSTSNDTPASDRTPDAVAEATSGSKAAPDGARARPHRERAGGERRRRLRSALTGVLYGVPVPVLLVILWDRGVAGAWLLPFGIQMEHLPAPYDVARRFLDLAVGGILDDTYSGTLWEHLWASTRRVLQGFALAAAVAIPLGVVMGRSRVVFRLLEPTINLIRPIPVTAWAPLSLLIIGFGDQSTIFLVFLASVFAILLNTIAGVREVPERLVEAAAMLGTRPARTLYKVVLPAAMPSIIGGLRIALGLAWVILVVGETVGISTGLGALITQAREQSRTDLIVAVMIVIGLAGFLADRLLMLLVRLIAGRRPLIN
ncbi:ABC transporter permease [Streptomyces sp. DSM 44915]|uniref:ABC transporter permease n=1 Tax=Streptomyces chisholmiae TaxID=3075540 RepID=A0ABU2JIL3_9ACTN|nr:ABC transporter permease [Streptomyces sp. DSM 44915]MDT0264828.1 ABC transporter permease [Streptomyces sp. DSM 44915]